MHSVSYKGKESQLEISNRISLFLLGRRTCKGKTVTITSDNCVVVTPTPTSTKAANRYRRDTEERLSMAEMKMLCPKGQTACPIGFKLEAGYECLDLSEELESRSPNCFALLLSRLESGFRRGIGADALLHLSRLRLVR